MQTVIIFLIVIVVLVVAHELGHFFTAKLFGIRVDEFGLGYPPRAGKLFLWRGTQFTANWLPFGGFVKIFGEDEGSSDQETSFAYQRKWKRVLVIVAGILSNIILAMVLYSISFGIGFLAAPGDFPGSVATGAPYVMITSVLKNSPAGAPEAGLRVGDQIRSLSVQKESVEIKKQEDIISFVKNHQTDLITISYFRPKSGLLSSAVATPAPNANINDYQKSGPRTLGISIAEVENVRLPFFSAITTGIKYTFIQFKFIILSLGVLFAGIFKSGSSILSDVAGPVGIAQFAGQAYSLGAGSLLSFMALISVNLAVINLLPFPALDGGRLIIEFFTSRGRSKIPARVIGAINQIGFIILIVFMLYITYRDILKLVV